MIRHRVAGCGVRCEGKQEESGNCVCTLLEQPRAPKYRFRMKTPITHAGSFSTHHRTPLGRVVLFCYFFAFAGSAHAQSPAGSAKASVESVSLAVSPLVTKTADGERNLLLATIESTGLSNLTVRLISAAWAEPETRTIAQLASGKENVDFTVPPLTAATAVTVRIESPAGQRDFGPFTLQPPRQWTVYLAQHTHTDIG